MFETAFVRFRFALEFRLAERDREVAVWMYAGHHLHIYIYIYKYLYIHMYVDKLCISMIISYVYT